MGVEIMTKAGWRVMANDGQSGCGRARKNTGFERDVKACRNNCQPRESPGPSADSDSGYGAIYALSRHPSASHFFSPCVADSFSALPLTAPGIFVNFAPVDLTLNRQPRDGRRLKLFFPATHGYSPSVFVLNSVSGEFDAAAYDVFVVPSELFCTQRLDEINEKSIRTIIDQGWKKINPGDEQLSLTNGNMMDVHATPFDGLASYLRDVLHAEDDRAIFPSSYTQPIHDRGPAVFVAPYLANKATILQELATLETDADHWLNAARQRKEQKRK